MKIKCQETEIFQNTGNSFSSVSKGMENIISYLKGYLERTNEYVENIKTLNSKYNSKQNKNHLSPIEEFFRRMRIVIKAQITSLSRFYDMVDSEIKKCEKILLEQIECQKKFGKEVADAEEDYLTQIKEIERAKRCYYLDASSLEDDLRIFEKKRRGRVKSQADDDWPVKINEDIRSMIRSEKDYTKYVNKSNRFKQTFLERVFASTGSSQQLYEELEKIGKETVVNAMVYLKMAGKELMVEIDTYSLYMDKPILLEQNENNPQSTFTCLQDLVMEPYKIRLLTQEQTDDLSEEEIHNVIKTMYENMKQKALDYDIEFEGKKVKMNIVVKKMLTFISELSITKEEQQLIDTFIKEKKLRDVFLQKLNNLRSFGDFMWPKYNYNEVGRVMNLILDEIAKKIEIDTAKNVVILSQTFYYKENNAKVFLQSFIQDHSLFKQKEFWKNLMLSSIENELDDYILANKNQKISIKETEEDYNMKLSNIIFSQIVPLTDNMVGFNIPKEDIKCILDYAFSKHQIDMSHKELIMSVLDKNELNEVKPNSYKTNSFKQIETGFNDEKEINPSKKSQKHLETSPQNKGK